LSHAAVAIAGDEFSQVVVVRTIAAKRLGVKQSIKQREEDEDCGDIAEHLGLSFESRMQWK
jgi:hypothetical protein